MDKKLNDADLGANQAAVNEPTVLSETAGVPPEHFGMALDYLSARGVSPEITEAAKIDVVADARAEIDRQFEPLPAIIFPYHTLDGEPDWVEIEGNQLQFFRVRYLREPMIHGFVKRKAPRFRQLKDSGVHVYLPPRFDWRAIAADASIRLVVTEGECKALSLGARDVAAIGLGGVDCIWRRIDDEHRELHPVLAAFKWGGRDTAIVFDSDIAEKPNVLAAESRLAKQLTQRGAIVRPVRLPAGGAP